MKIAEYEIGVNELNEISERVIYYKYIARDKNTFSVHFLDDGSIVIQIVDVVAGMLRKKYLRFDQKDD